jgi:hypothetical protein
MDPKYTVITPRGGAYTVESPEMQERMQTKYDRQAEAAERALDRLIFRGGLALMALMALGALAYAAFRAV